MSDRNNVTLEAIADILREKERFLILCHVNPDEDTVGSGFALFLALESMGKDVRIACESLPTRRSGDYVDRDTFDTVDWDGGFDTALAEGRISSAWTLPPVICWVFSARPLRKGWI